MKKVAIVWVVCVLAGALLFAWMASDVARREQAKGEPLVKADFTLTTKGNKTVTADDLKGKYLLVYFGFTHCPDICPTSLLLMTNVLNQLGDVGAKVQPIFISLDPERDTPDLTAEYASHFGKGVLGLSGTPEQIKHAADAFKVYYSKVEQKDSALGYVVDHSGYIYLIGPKGDYITHFTGSVAEAEMKQEILKYVR